MTVGSWLRRSKKIYVLIGCLLLVSTAIRRDLRAYTPKVPPPLALHLDQSILKDGDLIFRTRNGLISQMILSQSPQGSFSHVGLVVKKGQVWTVIHAVPYGHDQGMHGVLQEKIDDFLDVQNTQKYAIYRFPNLTLQETGMMKNYLSQQLGKQFDDRFLMSSDDRLYCSELVVKALKKVGIQQANQLPKQAFMLMDEDIILPDAILNMPGLLAVN